MTEDKSTKIFSFDNSLARELKGFYAPSLAEYSSDPKLIIFNNELAEYLQLNFAGLNSHTVAEIFSGNQAPKGAEPLSQAYSGHQFGHFSAQLGDGRALLLGEVVAKDKQRYDIVLKGSGRTEFSRGGDGKSALGPVIREYLVSEAMHALNVPTTRALAAVTTGDNVVRETHIAGGVFTRVASSHIRVGSFQYFAARGEVDKVKQLADYTIVRHYPKCRQNNNIYLSFFEAVCDNQAKLIAKWMHLGFIHGVMNTDNMSISGQTIDYGPCAFMNVYHADKHFSSIDRNGRYAYKNQPTIGKWNLARLAECLLPLIDENNEQAIEKSTKSLNSFAETYTKYWLAGMRDKIGLTTQQDGDLELCNGLLSCMEGQNVDFTLLFRHLGGEIDEAVALFDDSSQFRQWLTQWKGRCATESISEPQRYSAMNQVNPLYIARNHKVEEAITAAYEGDYSLFKTLLSILENPFAPQDGCEDYGLPPPETDEDYKTFCGT